MKEIEAHLEINYMQIKDRYYSKSAMSSERKG
jgi:hypothetical protein